MLYNHREYKRRRDMIQNNIEQLKKYNQFCSITFQNLKKASAVVSYIALFFIFRNFFIFSVDNYKQIEYIIINTVNKVFEQEDDMTYKDVRVLMIKKNKSYNDLIGNIKNSRGEPYTTLQGLWKAMTKGEHKEEVCERVVSFLLQSQLIVINKRR